jgi:hypothetical protein
MGVSCHRWPVTGGALGVRQSVHGLEGSSGSDRGMRPRHALTWRRQLCGGGARLQCSGGRRTTRWEKWPARCSEAQLGASPKWREGEWGVWSESAHVEEGEDRGSRRGWHTIKRPLRPARQQRAQTAGGDVEHGNRGERGVGGSWAGLQEKRPGLSPKEQ